MDKIKAFLKIKGQEVEIPFSVGEGSYVTHGMPYLIIETKEKIPVGEKVSIEIGKRRLDNVVFNKLDFKEDTYSIDDVEDLAPAPLTCKEGIEIGKSIAEGFRVGLKKKHPDDALDALRYTYSDTPKQEKKDK